MKRAIRFDRGELRKPTRTAAGFLRADAYVTRVGVFSYLNTDGTTRRELRHPDEVFDAASLETLHLIPVTREHPAELVNDSNARQLSVGTTAQDAARSDHFIKSGLQITDRETIAEVESRDRSDLSCGYQCDKDMTPGVTRGIDGVADGLEFDLIQRSIRYNHIATTTKGRAGPEIAVPRMDSSGVDGDVAVMVLDSNPRVSGQQPGAFRMETIRIDGVEYEVSKQTAQAFRKYVADRETATAEAKKALDTQTARADAAEEEAEAEKKKGEDAKKEHDSAVGDEAIRKRVDARVKLVTDATTVLRSYAAKKKDASFVVRGKDLEVLGDGLPRLDNVADCDIRNLVIKAAAPNRNLDGVSDDYIAAAFDLVVDSVSRETSDAANQDADAQRSRNAVQSAAAGGNNADADADKLDTTKARAKMIADSENAWKKPTSGVSAD